MSDHDWAIYRALYIESTLFQWVYFTKHGVVAGRTSRPLYKSEMGIT